MSKLARAILVGLGVAIAGLTVLIVLAQDPTRAGELAGQAAVKDPWPEFVMVFKEENFDWDSGKSQFYDIYRYTHKSRASWRLELIESTRDPRVVGTWTSYEVGRFSSGAVADEKPAPASGKATNGPYVATWWLVPESPAQLGLDGKYRLVARDAAKVQLRFTESVPCTGLPGEWYARLCSSSKPAFSRSTEKFFSADRGIPMEIVERTEGRVVKRITVQELTYTGSISQ